LQAHGRFEKQYQAEGANFWDLKDLGEDLELPVWVTLQAKQEFETKVASTRAAAGSYDKSRICDLLLSINEVSVDKRRKPSVTVEGEPESEDKADSRGRAKLELYVAKNRDDESKLYIPIESDLKRMLIREIEQEDFE